MRGWVAVPRETWLPVFMVFPSDGIYFLYHLNGDFGGLPAGALFWKVHSVSCVVRACIVRHVCVLCACWSPVKRGVSGVKVSICYPVPPTTVGDTPKVRFVYKLCCGSQFVVGILYLRVAEPVRNSSQAASSGSTFKNGAAIPLCRLLALNIA